MLDKTSTLRLRQGDRSEDEVRREMELFDRMHPACREAIRNAPFNFDLLSMPQTAVNWAIGKPKQAPGRFLEWFEREVDAVRQREEDI